MAGMLDNWPLANNPQALSKGMGGRVRDHAALVPDEQRQRMPNVELGEMNDILYQLAGSGFWFDGSSTFGATASPSGFRCGCTHGT